MIAPRTVLVVCSVSALAWPMEACMVKNPGPDQRFITFYEKEFAEDGSAWARVQPLTDSLHTLIKDFGKPDAGVSTLELEDGAADFKRLFRLDFSDVLHPESTGATQVTLYRNERDEYFIRTDGGCVAFTIALYGPFVAIPGGGFRWLAKEKTDAHFAQFAESLEARGYWRHAVPLINLSNPQVAVLSTNDSAATEVRLQGMGLDFVNLYRVPRLPGGGLAAHLTLWRNEKNQYFVRASVSGVTPADNLFGPFEWVNHTFTWPAGPKEKNAAGQSQLLMAIAQGGVDEVARRLAADRSLVHPPRGETPPLCYAIMLNKVAIARLLVEAGSDVNDAGTTGNPPLVWAVIQGDMELVKLLLEKGADPNSAITPSLSALQLAERNGRDDIAAALTRHGAKR